MDGHKIKSTKWTDHPTGMISSYRDDYLKSTRWMSDRSSQKDNYIVHKMDGSP